MLPNEQFIKAKKDKQVQSLIVINRIEGEERKISMYLCLKVKIPYTDKEDWAFIYTDVDMTINNYSESRSRSTETICFHLDRWNDNYVTNFLNSINSKSDVKFKVVAYNGCDVWKECNLVSHQLYGYINDKEYFLSSYVGRDNTASPVR